jgi:hypothetical protein
MKFNRRWTAGGLCDVYRVRDEQLNREIAINALIPRTLAEETSRKRFRKKAQALPRLIGLLPLRA